MGMPHCVYNSDRLEFVHAYHAYEGLIMAITQTEYAIRNLQIEVDGLKRVVRELQRENHDMRVAIGRAATDMTFARM